MNATEGQVIAKVGVLPGAEQVPVHFTALADGRAVATLASLSGLINYLPEEDQRRIRDAYRFGDEAHLGQFRSSGEPYISHPIAVAEICAQWRLDTESLMAALLHDTIEDTGVTKQALLERFGHQVADLVDGLSKLDRVRFETKEAQQAESFRKMLLAMARDVRVILIKLADRLHNMRTLGAVSPQKARRIANETLDIYAPIASRLGLYNVFRELLDLSFRAMHPFRYGVLRRALNTARGNRRELLSKIFEAVQKKLPEAGVVAEVYGREKTLFSIYEKMRAKSLSFAQVLDIYGFRVIVNSVPECYLALGALHATFKPVPGRFKDYIALPKVNGYQSLHTTLFGPFGTPVEFQIRTREMQRVAEVGVASHWLYKAADESFSDLQKHTHRWLQSLLDIQSNTGDPLEFFDHVRVDLFPDEVYIFTPRGEIRGLPRGATVIDYAYSVHTDIGNHAVAAQINQEPAALRTELQNGDHVEIITDAASRPNPNWLSFVRTGRARAEIRHFLKTMKYQESVDLGHRLLDQALSALRIDFGSLDAQLLEKTARDAGVKNIEELYAEIGIGKRLAPVEARAMALQSSGRSAAAAILPRLAPMLIRGNEQGAVAYAPCCKPVPGDDIIGHLRGGHGLVLHRTHCKTALRQRDKDPERWIPVQWSEQIGGLFRTDIELTVDSDRGVLGKVAAEIAASDANIVHVVMDEEAASSGQIRFGTQVRDRVHLAQLLRNLRKLSEVKRVARVY
ncbi:MAG: bifunctional (p)ppGpp synthetase/guanosine-3',5'-bis(diphosphate) 3'-pyrophosphohydrolase [Burkholderiaceae bacterium]|nr:bifunctional (p)ppGpp synthetase/guanosine-3',5'-bis(diphosphate) 3'-pyrophosphohydrolase [Burkholderiaceae bacterium]